MSAIHLVGTADTKAPELIYLRQLICEAGHQVICVDVGTRAPECDVDIGAEKIASCHPDGPDVVLAGDDRGQAVSAMGVAFSRFCADQEDNITAIIGIGGGGGTSIVAAGMRTLRYGIPKLMVSTLASGDVAPYVGTSDIIMMPSVTDIAGLNRISRHILYNAAQAISGMAARPYVPLSEAKLSIGLSMFGVTTPCVTAIAEILHAQFDCVVFHATGTGGRSMEQLLGQGMLSGLIDITTTEIADELFGGVLSAGPTRLDAVIASRTPYVGSVGALDMVNFWGPDSVPDCFKDRLLYHHNPNVTLMRTTVDENAALGRWIGEKLNKAEGPVRILLPQLGVSALDIEGGPFWDPKAKAALFETLESTIRQTPTRQVARLPYHINDPAFSAAAAAAYLEIQ